MPFTKSSLDFLNLNFEGLYHEFTDFKYYNEEEFDLLNVWFVIDGDQGKVSNLNLALLDYTKLSHSNFNFDYTTSDSKFDYTRELYDNWYSHFPLKFGQGYIFYTNKTPHSAWKNYSKPNLFGRKSLEMRVVVKRIYNDDKEKKQNITLRNAEVSRWLEGFTPEQLEFIEAYKLKHMSKLKSIEVSKIEGEKLRLDDIELMKLTPDEIDGLVSPKLYRVAQLKMDGNPDRFNDEYKLDIITIKLTALMTEKLGISLTIKIKPGHNDYGRVYAITKDSILKDHIQIGDKLIRINNRAIGPAEIPKLKQRPLTLEFSRRPVA